MRAVVTGATGCIGAVLCRELKAQGWWVRALVRPGRQHTQIAGFVAEVRTGDILAPESLKGLADGADVVFHLAARVTDHGSRRQFQDAILAGTRNMLQASAGRAGRFVQVSSTTACGVGKHLRARKEDDPCFRSRVPYSDAKLEAEASGRVTRRPLPGRVHHCAPVQCHRPRQPLCGRSLPALPVTARGAADRPRPPQREPDLCRQPRRRHHPVRHLPRRPPAGPIISATTGRSAGNATSPTCPPFWANRRKATSPSTWPGPWATYLNAYARRSACARRSPAWPQPSWAGTTTWTPPGHKPSWGGRHESLTRRPCGKSAGTSIVLSRSGGPRDAPQSAASSQGCCFRSRCPPWT